MPTIADRSRRRTIISSYFWCRADGPKSGAPVAPSGAGTYPDRKIFCSIFLDFSSVVIVYGFFVRVRFSAKIAFAVKSWIIHRTRRDKFGNKTLSCMLNTRLVLRRTACFFFISIFCVLTRFPLTKRRFSLNWWNDTLLENYRGRRQVRRVSAF